MDYSKEEIINYYMKYYPCLDYEKISIMYDCAYDILKNRRYPSQNLIEIPEDYLKSHKTWIFRAIEEHLENQGIPKNITSYSENGISVTFESTDLSKKLLSEITPLAKIGWLK